ncbi:hypothetical protein SAMN05216303_102275 [Rhodoferax sp. OV413]|uniref:hypothetical protein n=1 Tax=Rhodoferax sp. OV413 TaxID=1855285 RepID=UPI00088BC099|nr:hypothetical protein [Rhodoferax sp. OV413]SDO75630.1 hypothetical protein SAMN05216303_102275 [Rhodoferax sp. OV413]
MTTPVYIDSCAWNYLFDTHVVMRDVFPPDEYMLYITREVEIELSETPNDGKDGSDKRPLKQFIHESIAQSGVRTTGNFGFRTYESDGTPSKHQVNLGFGQGGFQPSKDRQWYADKDVRAHLDGKPKRKSGLHHNQADASLGVRSFDAIVLTNEKRGKAGPLTLAAKQSGYILYLGDLGASGLNLKEFLRRARHQWFGSNV